MSNAVMLCLDAELLYADCHSAKCHKDRCKDAITDAAITFGSSIKLPLYWVSPCWLVLYQIQLCSGF
jgi:hypothetical protein